MIENIDATIIAQRPKLASYRPQMEENIAEALHLDPSRVSVKATTEEGLGFTGSGGNCFSGNYIIDGNSGLLL